MNYSEDEMATDLTQLQPTQDRVFTEQPSVPQSTMQRAPPMRFGQVENFPTHQTIRTNPRPHPVISQSREFNVIPPPRQEFNYVPEAYRQPEKVGGFFENLLGGIYDRLKEPVIIIILFMVFAHRLTVKSINPFFPFVGENASLDPVSLAYRGFIVAVLFMMIRNYF